MMATGNNYMEDGEIIRQFNQNATEHQNFMEKLEKFGEKLDGMKSQLDKLPEVLTDKFDERYASKDTETSLKRVMWIVITAVIVALLALVIKSQ